MPYGLKIGKGFITDLLDPQPEQIDLSAIEHRLRSTRRFTNNPAALTVHQHRHIVRAVAMRCRFHPPHLDEAVREWCHHHDDHEGVIGDIPGPLKNLISETSPILSEIEKKLDWAICVRRGIALPTDEVRGYVHTYDKIAETIEWVYVLGEPLAEWNKPIPDNVNEEFIYRHLDIARFG